MTQSHMLRVFTDPNGNFGDSASLVIDEGKHISNAERQAITRKLGTGETVFVNDVAKADISIMHYHGEIDFAGVAALAASWFLANLKGGSIKAMHGRGGDIITWQEDDLSWVRASLTTMPPWKFKQLDSAKAVEQVKLEDTVQMEHTMIWAWIDEAKGLIRARTFASDWGMPEAKGNGSGSMVLAAQLGRDIEIKHGEGSVIFAKPAINHCADIGGRVVEQ
jgi:predicted PhzF superfamily epimerase YddE/YHI9